MRMMEVINNLTATVYYRGNVDEATGKFDHSSTILKVQDKKNPPKDYG